MSRRGRWPRWFIARRERFPIPDNACHAAAGLYHKGVYEFNDRDHHGTPAGRLAAFRAGFEFNLSSDTPSGGSLTRAA